MATTTLTFNANIGTRNKIIGIAKNTAKTSTSSWFSQGSEVLSTEQDIRDTKKVRILIPFLLGAKQVSDVLTEAQGGGVKLGNLKLGERSVELTNELITDPVIWRPRDGEVIDNAKGDELLSAYQQGFVVSATKVKDYAFYKTILKVGKDGLSTGEKAQFIDTTAMHALTDGTQPKVAAGLLDEAIARVLDHEDGVFAGSFNNSDIKIGISSKFQRILKADKKYAILTPTAYEATGVGAEGIAPTRDVSTFLYDQTYQTKVIKEFNKLNVDALITISGAASSNFLFQDVMNFDKVVGVNAYALSLEFNEGTGVWFPQLISVLAKTADYASQNAVGSGTLDLSSIAATSTTTSQNPAAANAPFTPADEQIDKPTANSTLPVIKAWLDLKGIDYTGKTTKAELLALVV